MLGSIPVPSLSLKAHFLRYKKLEPGTYRVVVAGVSNVGKSALVVRFIQGKYVDICSPTIEDSYRKMIEIGGSQCILDLMDTAGVFDFTDLRDQYLKRGDGFVLVYSITWGPSFKEIDKIRRKIMEFKGDQPYVPMILVGNKCDCESERVVSREEAAEFARKYNMGFLESSARCDIHVREIFYDIMRYMSHFSVYESHEGKPQQQKKRNLDG